MLRLIIQIFEEEFTEQWSTTIYINAAWPYLMLIDINSQDMYLPYLIYILEIKYKGMGIYKCWGILYFKCTLLFGASNTY